MAVMRPLRQVVPAPSSWRRAMVGVLSISAVLLPALGIAYLGAVSYREDRGIVAATLARQFQAATALASAIESELDATVTRTGEVLGGEPPHSRALTTLAAEHPLAAFPFRLAPGGRLTYPAAEPLRKRGPIGGDFLSQAPRTCPERAFDACIRAIREARRRARRLDVARRRELEACSGSGPESTTIAPCRLRPRDRELARRTYSSLVDFEDSGPQALLGLARLARSAGQPEEALGHYQVLRERFGNRLDDDAVSYSLIADLGAAEATGDASAFLSVYRRIVAREYDAPSAVLDPVAEEIQARLATASISSEAASERDELGAQVEQATRQARLARALAGEVDETVRTAGPLVRGRPALTSPERTLIYRRQADGSIIGVLVDIAMLEALAAELADAQARADEQVAPEVFDLSGLAAGTRPMIERPGHLDQRSASIRALASTGFGPVLPHLSLTLVNDRRLPDPLDEIVEARGRRHLAITGALVALLVIGLLATIRGTARERELARLKSDLVSTVSHELKTPLTSIRMFGEMLQQGVAGSDREREARYHDIIVAESQRLGLLIANLLDYSQIERGTRRYARHAERAVDIARDAVATFQRFRDEPAEIEVVAGPPGESVSGADNDDSADERDAVEQTEIVVDREVVVQCLLNLLGNASKYGKPPITVTARLEPAHDRDASRHGNGARSVVLSVSDRGPGIPRVEHERIFREFYRAPAAYSSGVDGTGLGLALVKRHVEAQDGQVIVASEPGRGATFSITFPVHDARRDG